LLYQFQGCRKCDYRRQQQMAGLRKILW